MEYLFGELVGDLLASLVLFRDGRRSTGRDKVLHAVRLSRRGRLSRERHEYAQRWLTIGASHIEMFRLNSHEARIAAALDRIQSCTVVDSDTRESQRALTALDDAVLVPAAMAWAAATGSLLRRRGDHPDRTAALIAIHEARLSTLTAERRRDITVLLEAADADLAGYRLERHEGAVVEALYTVNPERGL